MAKFKDNEGREWIVLIVRSTIERVQSMVGVNLCEVLTGELFDRLQWDDVLIGKVLWGICKTEATDAGITQEQFYDRIQGDPIDEGTEAILEGLDGFFSQKKRRILRQMRDMVREAEATREKATGIFLEEMEKLSETGSSDSATASQESSE